MTILNTTQIKNHLAHRYPFLLIDRVIEFDADKYIKAVKNVTVNEPFFQGHFPGNPIMPGVLIIEAMAQAAALYGELCGRETLLKHGAPVEGDKDILYYLVGVDKARFRSLVEPGDQLIIVAEYISVRRNIWRFSARALVEGKVKATADLLTTVAVSES